MRTNDLLRMVMGEASRPHRRRFAILLALAVLAVSVGAALGATPSRARGDETGDVTELPAPSLAEVAAVEAKRREEQEWLASPEAAHEREASQDAFSKVSAGQAKNLLVEAFPEAMGALNEDPGRVLTGLEVEKPLGTYAAIVGNGHGGDRSLLETSVPVESGLGGEGRQPVDLALERSSGGYVPANPIAELELPGTAEGAIHLHEGVKVRLPTEDDHEAVPLGEENLFIPETERSTDTLLSPVAGGVEISEQLRSVESPHELTFELELPHGDTLEATTEGGAEVLAEGGAMLEEVPPPSAVDAQGATVPVEMKVASDSLVVEVADQGEATYAYPILVDPSFVEEWTNFGAWTESNGGGFGLRNLGSSLNAYSQWNQTYAANTHAQWVYTAPGETAFIKAATFYPIDYLPGSCGSEQPHGYIGLYNVSSNSYDSLYTYHSPSTALENWNFETGWVGGPSTRDATIGIGTAGAAVKIGCYHELYVGGYSIQLGDEDSPGWNYASGPSSWMDDSPLPISVSATDTGLGMEYYFLQISPAEGGWVTESSCEGSWESPCSRTWEAALTNYEPEDLPTGEDILDVYAGDPLENQSEARPVTLKVDHKPPSLTLSGSLATHGTLGMGKPEYTLRWKSEDGVTGASQSGVASVVVKVDGVVKHSETPGCSGSTNCSASGEWNFVASEYSDGKHEVTVTSTDAVGNVATRTLNVSDTPEVTSPESGERTSTRLKLAAAWRQSGYSHITWQYRLGKEGTWTNMPTGEVHGASGEAVEWPVSVEGQESRPLWWNVAGSELSHLDIVELEVRAVLEGGSNPVGESPPVSAQLNRASGGPKDASTPVGPGSLDLVTGNLSVPRTDVSIPVFGTALEFSRTYNSREAESGPTGVLGPGWIAGTPVEEAGGADWKSVRDAEATGEGPYAVVTDLEGYEYPFERLADGEYLAPPEAAGWELSKEGSTFVLADPEGNRTEFGTEAEPHTYLPTAVTQPGGTSKTFQMVKTQMVYELTGSNRRLKLVIGPSAEGVTCSPAGTPPAATTTLGCRSLSFTYETPSEWGGAEGKGDRLKSITYNGPFDAEGGHWEEGHWEVARYAYNGEGRLTEEWDPRISPPLKETYAYDSGGELRTVTPAGQKPWELGYEGEPPTSSPSTKTREGLLAAWSFDEGEGTAAHDASGNGETGTVEGAEWTEGKYGHALEFDGEDDCVSAPGISSSMVETGEFTVEAWVMPKRVEEDGGDPFIAQEDESAGEEEEPYLYMALAGGGDVPKAWVRDDEGESGYQGIYAGEQIPLDAWSHIALTDDGTHLRLYVDGELMSTEPAPALTAAKGDLSIGCDKMYGAYFKGSIDEPRIYDRALDEAEIGEDEETEVAREGEAAEGNEHLRLKTIRRASLSVGSEPATAQSTVAYGVPLEGASAPYAMGKTRVRRWGQTDAPVAATAIFPPDEVPAKKPAAYTRATVFYTDAEGQLVNTASPSGAGPLEPAISTTERDEHGNIVRELSIDNRLRALSAGGESVARSEQLETRRTYNPEGTELLEELGPLHEVRLQSGSTAEARLHDVLTYEDSEAPTEEGVPAPHLPTKEVSGAEISGAEEAERQTTEYRYDWKLRELTDTIVDPGGLDIQTKTAYDDTTGLPVKQSQPSDPEGKGAGTTETVYYSAGGSGECKGQPQYAGLPCKVSPAAQVTGTGRPELLVTRFLAYNQLGEGTEISESPDGGPEHVRTTKITYDSAGRQLTSLIEGGGEAVPKTKTLYSGSLGLPIGQEFVCESSCSGFEHRAVATSYDALGRVTRYEDATGNVATTAYDIDGRPVTSEDAKGTRTVTYGPTSGLPTKLEDSGAGTFTASYDAEGNLVTRTLPDGLTAETTYNQVGEPMHLAYTKESSCGESCTWLAEGLERSIYGQILTDKGTLVDDAYAYDKDGRLTEAQETPTGGVCTSRSYTYDADSNRLTKTTREGAGSCPTTGGTTQNYSYDAADRLEGEGLTYDSFGRITNLAGKFAGGSELQTEYFSTNMIEKQSQGGVTNTYGLDATLRQDTRTQTGGGHEGKEVFHFDGPGDAPAWTERGSTWTRDVAGIGGELAAVQESGGGVTLQLTDLHGDVVATANPSPAATKLLAKFRFDEFGEPVAGEAGRFGWLGGKERRTELASGVIQMGERSYLPSVGRFLSPDPVPGGSANTYDYADQDPVDGSDLAGTMAGKKKGFRNKVVLGSKLGHKVSNEGPHAVATVTARAYAEASPRSYSAAVHIQITGGKLFPVNVETQVEKSFEPTNNVSETCAAGGLCETQISQSVEFDTDACVAEVAGYVSVKAWLSWTTASGVQRSSVPIERSYLVEGDIACEVQAE